MSLPRYDYKCPECDERFEVERRLDESRDESCPECGATAKRVFTPVGVHFKGSGFHNTDYRSKPKESPAPCPAKQEGSSPCASCPAAD